MESVVRKKLRITKTLAFPLPENGPLQSSRRRLILSPHQARPLQRLPSLQLLLQCIRLALSLYITKRGLPNLQARPKLPHRQLHAPIHDANRYFHPQHRDEPWAGREARPGSGNLRQDPQGAESQPPRPDPAAFGETEVD